MATCDQATRVLHMLRMIWRADLRRAMRPAALLNRCLATTLTMAHNGCTRS